MYALNGGRGIMEKAKKTVGYIRTYSVHESDNVQQRLIERYCEANSIDCSKIYQDRGYRDRHVGEMQRAEKLGLPQSKFFHTFPDSLILKDKEILSNIEVGRLFSAGKLG